MSAPRELPDAPDFRVHGPTHSPADPPPTRRRLNAADVDEGEIDVILRTDLNDGAEQRLHLGSGEACVIPTGTWHRQVVVAPCKMLFPTPETLHRPYAPSGGWRDPVGG